MLRHQILTIFLLFCFLLMILFPRTVFLGASEGLLLWFQTVLPTLLPYMILNNLMIHTSALHWICRITAPLFQRIFSVSYYGSFAVLSGFLCGYPVGAKTTADLLNDDFITYNEAGYLLSFCNNTSPAFVISYVINQNLKVPSLTAPLFLFFSLSPVLTSFLFRHFYPFKQNAKNSQAFCLKKASNKDALFDLCIINAFESLTKIGGYMMLFSICIRLLSRFSPSTPFWLFLYSTLELSTGIRMIAASSFSFTYKVLFSATLTSFGGWCCVMQTHSMTSGSGVALLPYIAEKLVTAVVTSLLVSAYIYYMYAY